MLRNGVIVILIFVSIHSMCQDWIRIYGEGQSTQSRDIIEDYDKGYIISGMIGNYKFAWIQKIDINGDTLWHKWFGNAHLQVGTSNIEKTDDGGYIFCGTWTKFNTSWDAFIIKLNSCAEVEWCKTLITPLNYDMGIRVKPTPESDYLLLGGYFLTDPVSNVSLFKFNSFGELIWHQFYPMDSIYYEDQPKDLLVDNDGYMMISSRYYPDSGSTGPAIIRHYFTKTDTAGNQLWSLVYGANDYYYGWPWRVEISNTGNYYEVGNHLLANGTGNPAFVKVLQNGAQSYNKDIISGLYWGGLSSIDFLEDSLMIMVGGWHTDINTPNDGFFKTDTFGNLRGMKEIVLLSNGYEATAKSFDNKFLTVGNDMSGGWRVVAVKVNSDLEYDSIYTQPFTYDSLCPYPIISSTVDPDCENVYVGIEEPFKDPETTKLKVFPNPATDYIAIEAPKYLVVHNITSTIPSTTVYHQWGSATLEVYDLFGRKMMEKEVIRAEREVVVDISQWKTGMYVARLVFKSHTVASEKFIVER